METIVNEQTFHTKDLSIHQNSVELLSTVARFTQLTCKFTYNSFTKYIGMYNKTVKKH